MSNRSRTKRSKRKRVKRLGQQLSVGGTVTVATVGLSTCLDNGAVDPPPPPPLDCADVSAGQSFVVSSATRVGAVVTVVLFNDGRGSLIDSLAVIGLQNLTLASIDHNGNAVSLDLILDPEATSSGRFTLSGRLRSLDATNECYFTRTFTVTINGSNVEVAQQERSLPLARREGARIELVRRNGLQVKLRASGAPSDLPLFWSITAGSLRVEDEGHVAWELPAKQGFYQVELLTDHGEDGFGFDTLSFEVA